jgi:hypothetical protein
MALVPLTVVSTELEAQDVRGLLRVNGIDSAYRATSMGGGLTGIAGPSGPTEVLVDEADLERAQELLDAPVEDEDDGEPSG